MNSYQVTDHFRILQCYRPKCQGFGHKSTSKFCPVAKSKDSICLYCSSKHKSNACPYKNDTNEFYCYNCKKIKAMILKTKLKDKYLQVGNVHSYKKNYIAQGID